MSMARLFSAKGSLRRAGNPLFRYIHHGDFQKSVSFLPWAVFQKHFKLKNDGKLMMVWLKAVPVGAKGTSF